MSQGNVGMYGGGGDRIHHGAMHRFRGREILPVSFSFRWGDSQHDDDVGFGGTYWRIALIIGAMQRSKGRRVWPLIISFPSLPIVSLSVFLSRTCPQPCLAERMAARSTLLCTAPALIADCGCAQRYALRLKQGSQHQKRLILLCTAPQARVT